MIPKVINYCWFGGNPLTEKAEMCIKSWKTFLPDYEIRRWDESNFDIEICQYVKEAYAAKKWAFVADYFRIWVLYYYGGIYFDSDVEVTKSFDEFLDYELFTGYETDITLEPAVVGCISGHTLFKELLGYFTSKSFYSNGNEDLTPLPYKFTEPFTKNYGLTLNNQRVLLDNNQMAIYPTDWFSPMDYETGELKKTDNTHAIHRYAASWVGGGTNFRAKIYSVLSKLFGKKFAYKMRKKFGRQKKEI